MSEEKFWLLLTISNGGRHSTDTIIERLELTKSDLSLLYLAINKARLIPLDGNRNEELHQLFCRFKNWEGICNE